MMYKFIENSSLLVQFQNFKGRYYFWTYLESCIHFSWEPSAAFHFLMKSSPIQIVLKNFFTVYTAVKSLELPGEPENIK